MQLATFKNQIKKQLIHRCDVFAKKRIRVGSDWQELYVRVETQVPCRMSTNSPRDTEIHTEYQQKFLAFYTLISMPMQIKSDDRVILYLKNEKGEWVPDPFFFETKAEPRNPSFLNVHYETPCENMTRSYTVKELTVNQVTFYYLDENDN